MPLSIFEANHRQAAGLPARLNTGMCLLRIVSDVHPVAEVMNNTHVKKVRKRKRSRYRPNSRSDNYLKMAV